MDKEKVFEKELKLIKDADIFEFTRLMVNILPDYFFTIPASSTGKFHPSYALGEGGLVRHTKAAVKIANEMFGLEMFKLTDKEKDIVLSALILHDGAKSGIPQSRFTIHNHPIVIADYIKKNTEIANEIDEETLNSILSCIKSHMGQWTESNYSNVILPKPNGKLEKFVHLADYLASRKCIEINFEE